MAECRSQRLGGEIGEICQSDFRLIPHHENEQTESVLRCANTCSILPHVTAFVTFARTLDLAMNFAFGLRRRKPLFSMRPASHASFFLGWYAASTRSSLWLFFCSNIRPSAGAQSDLNRKCNHSGDLLIWLLFSQTLAKRSSIATCHPLTHCPAEFECPARIYVLVRVNGTSAEFYSTFTSAPPRPNHGARCLVPFCHL